MKSSRWFSALARLSVAAVVLAWQVQVFGQVHTAKGVLGTVTNSDGTIPLAGDIDFTAYISSRPAEKLTEASPGCSVEGGANVLWVTVEVSAFTTAWAPNDVLVVEVTNTANGGFKVSQLTLDTQGFQEMAILLENKPFISEQPQNATGVVGAPYAHFAVEATGTEPLSYFWRKGGSALQDGTKYSGAHSPLLYVQNLTTADAGVYTVLVSNRLGTVLSAEATLTILVPPTISQQPQSRTVTQNVAQVQFSVTLANPTGVQYFWFKGATPLQDGAKYGGTHTATLTVSNVATSDAGAYSVTVENQVTNVTSSDALLTVLVPPAVVIQPQGLIVTQGVAQAQFTVDAGGTAPLSYSWRKGGTALSGSKYNGLNTTTLTVLNPTSSDAGDYSVLVSNAAGTALSSNAPLTVLVPPSITQQPVSRTVTQGVAQVQFSVGGAGSQPLSYLWFNAGGPLPEGDKFTGVTSSTLTVLNPQDSDAGQFWAVVSNVLGQVVSSNAALTVLVPPMLHHPPMSLTATQNGSATFFVMAFGTQPLTYQWKRNGNALSDSSTVTGSQSNTLTVRNLTTNADNGAKFAVTVSNLAGSTNSPEAILTVVPGNAAPEIFAQPSDQRVPLGGTATFQVQNSGYPMPSYQWFLNATNPLANGGRITGADTASLVISNASGADVGTYSVFLSNMLGTVTSSNAALTIVYPPVITMGPSNQTLVVGQTLAFQVLAQGTDPFAFQWFKDNVRLTGETQPALIVTNIQTANAGAYKAVVTNLAGAATSEVATVTVLVPPAITQQPRSQTNCAGGNLTLTVTATGTAPLGYQWSQNGLALPDATASSLSLTNVQAATTGDYLVVVSNGAGLATSALARIQVNLPPSLAAQPQDQTVTPGSTVTFDVLANGGEPITYQWRKDGVDLAGATAASLVLSNVNTNHQGSYSVRVVNPCGTTNSGTASLTVVDRALQVASANTVPATNVILPVDLVAVGNESMVHFTLNFDTNLLTLTGLTAGADATNATLIWANTAVGEVQVGLIMSNNGAFGAGRRRLALAEFVTSSNVTTEAISLVTFGTTNRVWDAATNLLVFKTINGVVDIKGTTPIASVPSPGTGLFDGTLSVAIPVGGIPAGRALIVRVKDLGVDSRGRAIQVFNATGTTNGDPFFLINGPIAAGQLTLTVQFIVLDRVTIPHPRFVVEEIAGPAQPTLVGTPITILPEWTKFTAGGMYIQFLTQAGRTYYVQYKANVTDAAWKTVFPSMTGTGGWVVWLDNGPPKTESKPADATMRIYQVLLSQ